MPSLVLDGRSGGNQLVSGCLWSGQPASPVGGVQLRAAVTNSGYVYVTLSGGVTITSGQMPNSGGSLSGRMDGMPMGPGDAYWIPRLATGISGTLSVWAAADSACSGQARVFYEIY